MHTFRAALDAEQLRYAAKVSRSGPLYLHALLQTHAGDEWRQELVEAMRRLQRAVAPKLDALPDPGQQEGAAAWEAFWIRWPGQWAQLVQAYVPRGLADARRPCR